MGGHARRKTTSRDSAYVPCTAVCTPGSSRTAGARLPRARARSGCGCCTARCTAARAPRAIASWCPSLAGGDRKFDLRRKADLGATRRGDRRLRSRLGPTPTLRGRVARQPAACAHHPDAHALKIRGRHPSARLVWRASGPRKPFSQGLRLSHCDVTSDGSTRAGENPWQRHASKNETRRRS